jgi:hypothetical protein
MAGSVSREEPVARIGSQGRHGWMRELALRGDGVELLLASLRFSNHR